MTTPTNAVICAPQLPLPLLLPQNASSVARVTNDMRHGLCTNATATRRNAGLYKSMQTHTHIVIVGRYVYVMLLVNACHNNNNMHICMYIVYVCIPTCSCVYMCVCACLYNFRRYCSMWRLPVSIVGFGVLFFPYLPSRYTFIAAGNHDMEAINNKSPNLSCNVSNFLEVISLLLSSHQLFCVLVAFTACSCVYICMHIVIFRYTHFGEIAAFGALLWQPATARKSFKASIVVCLSLSAIQGSKRTNAPTHTSTHEWISNCPSRFRCCAAGNKWHFMMPSRFVFFFVLAAVLSRRSLAKMQLSSFVALSFCCCPCHHFDTLCVMQRILVRIICNETVVWKFYCDFYFYKNEHTYTHTHTKLHTYTHIRLRHLLAYTM